MSATRPHLVQALETLLAEWEAQHPKRAAGGWWALAGFSFQAGVYLLEFFRALYTSSADTRIEALSDILSHRDTSLRLIQVKRTLTRSSLRDALHEAYLITQVCRQKTPALLPQLTFQIACSSNESTAGINDLTMADVISTGGDAAVWAEMRRRFDPRDPIVQQSDPLERLHTFLWSIGIADPVALVQTCHGALLQHFGKNDPGSTQALALQLNHLFHEAKRRKEWKPLDRLVTSKDFAPTPGASREVLTGEPPKREHLNRGCFRERKAILEDLWSAFSEWLVGLGQPGTHRKIPVFWVSGRSGDGKSVLLLQLMARFISSPGASPLLHMPRGGELPVLLEQAASVGPRTSSGWILAAIDDVYDLPDREGWDEDVRRATSLATPPVALLTCGPKEQMEEFRYRLGDQVEVRPFHVPWLTIDECREFVTWYETRTGERRDMGALTTDNPLLVQFVFEMAQGQSLRAFAVRFAKRLEQLRSLDSVRMMLAVNALYLNAPGSLLATNEELDAIERLEQELHIRTVYPAGGKERGAIRLAHPHLAWRLYTELAGPGSLAKIWARDLARVIAITEQAGQPLFPAQLLYQLTISRRPFEAGRGPPGIENRRELIRELYRLHIMAHGGRPTIETVPRWLALESSDLDLHLKPDPVDVALVDVEDDARAARLHGSVVFRLWDLASRSPERSARMKGAARAFLLRFPNNPGVFSALTRLASRKRGPEIQRLVRDWLDQKSTHPLAYRFFAPEVAAHPEDEALLRSALDWARTHFADPHVYWLLATLAKASRQEGFPLAIEWYRANQHHPQAYHVLGVLVTSNPSSTEARKLAREWLEQHPDEPHSYWLIAPLLARVDEPWIHTLASRWLKENVAHPGYPETLKAMIARTPEPAEWMACGEQFLAMPNARSPWIIAAVLVIRSKAEARYVDLALEVVDRLTQENQRSFVNNDLGGALAKNPKSVLSYLAGNHAPERKQQICALLSSRMVKFPSTIPRLLTAIAPHLDAPYLAILLQPLIDKKVESERLDLIIVQQLGRLRGHPGYESLLQALRSDPVRWARLRPGISELVRVDVEGTARNHE